MQERRLSNTQQRALRQCLQLIAVKFLLNLPSQQKQQKIRLAYHYMKAYYFYIDEAAKQLNPRQNTKEINIKWFIDKLNSVIGNWPYKVSGEDVIKTINKHKPTCGAIILNQRQTKVLVLEACGRYGFPKGGKDETDTCEDCAGREVWEETGLFIHRLINSNDKIEYMGEGDVMITYFIVRNFNINEPIKVNPNEVTRAFWMNVADVPREFGKFSKKAREAWRHFEPKLHVQPALTMDSFLSMYRDKTARKKNQLTLDVNPLLNFNLDKERLFSVFKQTSVQ